MEFHGIDLLHWQRGRLGFSCHYAVIVCVLEGWDSLCLDTGVCVCMLWRKAFGGFLVFSCLSHVGCFDQRKERGTTMVGLLNFFVWFCWCCR